MSTEKIIIILLMIAILLSVITLAITINSNLINKAGDEGNSNNSPTTANVVLEIIKNPDKGENLK